MPKLKSSLLWSFENKENVSYIFGTMHVKDYRVHQFTDQLSQYISQCAAFACEFHLDEFSNSNMQSFGSIPDNKSISELYSDHKYQRIRTSILKAFDIDILKMDQILPLFLVNQISESVMVNSESMSLDSLLWQKAKQLNRQMYGLESVEDQFRILKAIPLTYQLAALQKIARNTKSFRRKIAQLIQLYEKQELHTLYQFSKRSLGKQKRLLLYNRNINMVKEISNILQQNGSLFCAVGAAHLSGKYGILARLKREGYRVRPIAIGQ